VTQAAPTTVKKRGRRSNEKARRRDESGRGKKKKKSYSLVGEKNGETMTKVRRENRWKEAP